MLIRYVHTHTHTPHVLLLRLTNVLLRRRELEHRNCKQKANSKKPQLPTNGLHVTFQMISKHFCIVKGHFREPTNTTSTGTVRKALSWNICNVLRESGANLLVHGVFLLFLWDISSSVGYRCHSGTLLADFKQHLIGDKFQGLPSSTTQKHFTRLPKHKTESWQYHSHSGPGAKGATPKVLAGWEGWHYSLFPVNHSNTSQVWVYMWVQVCAHTVYTQYQSKLYTPHSQGFLCFVFSTL